MRTIQGILPYRPYNQLAIVAGNESSTVGEFLAFCAQITSVITGYHWPAPNPRILIPSQFPISTFAALLACHAAGATAVPWRPKSQPLKSVASVVQPNAVLKFTNDAGEAPSIELLEASRETWPGDLIILTSGSTGQPKGVVSDLMRFVVNAALAGMATDLTDCDAWSTETDPALASAIGHFLMAWQAELPLYFLANHSTTARRELFAKARMGFGGAPLQLVQIANGCAGYAHPTVLVSSGDFLPGKTIEQVRKTLPNCRIVKMYGLTELAGRFCVATDELLRRELDTAGWPLPGFAAKIVPDNESETDERTGEVAVSSPLLFHGYCRAGRGYEARSPGYFLTGDLGVIKESGAITLLGRRDDVFKVSGEKVDRLTIEKALNTLMVPHEYCVLPVPNDLLGSLPVLFVGALSGIPIPNRDEIVSHIRSRLPSGYIPGAIHIVDGPLPKLGNGKVDKQKLLAQRSLYRKLT